MTSCNHLLYPAVKEPYILAKNIQPVPHEIFVNFKDDFNSQVRLHAWHFKSIGKNKKRLVVHFHGNGQNLTTHFMFFKWMVEEGYDYLIFDYRGYGQSTSVQTNQKLTVQDGTEILKYVKNQFKDYQIIAIGQSLGTNILQRTLQELVKNNQLHLLPQFVVLDSAFISYQSAASSVLGQRWFLYPLKPFAYLTISDEWSAEANIIYNPNIPALFLHGSEDKIINYSLGLKAFDKWLGPKAFLTQTGGFHTSAFIDQRFNQSKKILLKCIDLALKLTSKSTEIANFKSCLLIE